MSNHHDSFLDALPDGWTFDRLKDVVVLRNEKCEAASSDEDYLELEDLESGSGRILNRRNTLEVESAVTLFKKGDVLFGKLRPYLEKYYEAEFDGKCTGEILAFKPERIASRFLFYCVGSRWFIERCNAFAYGAKMPRVSWPTQLSQFTVPLPPLPEQQRIGAYLDASCAAIDAAVAAKRRQLETLEALRRTVIQESVTKGLDSNVEMRNSDIDWLPEIPKHWNEAKLKRHVQMIRGQFSHRPRNDPTFYDGPYPFIQTGSISSVDKFITEFTQTLNEEGLRISKLFPADTVVMTITGAKIAEVAVTTFEACFPDSIVGFVPDHRLNRDYLFYLLVAMQPTLLRAMVVTTQPNINYVQIGGNYIPLPPVKEQELIAEHIEQKIQGIIEIQNSLNSQITTLATYRKSLIHECVTGHRRITEPDVQRAAVKRKFDNLALTG
jgi:type I restriction enzyme S subunit